VSAQDNTTKVTSHTTKAVKWADKSIQDTGTKKGGQLTMSWENVIPAENEFSNAQNEHTPHQLCHFCVFSSLLHF